MNIRLYRYISFEDFINLVINNKDRFVRPSSWDDKYEGYLFSHMETPEDVHQIVSEMYRILCPQNYHAIPQNYFKMWNSKWYTYAQCWSAHSETDAMWRCYSYGNRSIRIRTRYKQLLDHANQIFPENQKFNVHLRKVNYDLSKGSIIEQQIQDMQTSLLPHETYFHKRSVFKHEKEYRLLIMDNRWYFIEELSLLSVNSGIDEAIQGKTDEEIIAYLTEKICAHRVNLEKFHNTDVRIEDAGNIDNFLEGVMVHPAAPEWYVDLVEDICKQKNIKFDGQSEIYKLK